MTRMLAMVGAVCAMAAVTAAAQVAGASAPKETPLWPGGAPDAHGNDASDTPAVWFYPAPEATATGAAVVVCPGGGYGGLAMDHEGHEVARWFNTFGVSAAVLRYRHAPGYAHPVPLHDAQRAVRWMRANAAAFHIDPARIGILGFSAGGHLAATASTQFDAGSTGAADPVDRVSSRPDFAILAYPVITLTSPFTHAGSRDNLLGPNASKEMIDALSAEKHVTKQTPPVFLFHTANDDAVPVENSLMLFQALHAAGVPAEMHIYREGPHGTGLNRNPSSTSWPGLAKDWMQHLGLLDKRPAGTR